ncbi:MAG: hypothetical protein GEU80_09260 [Dehalococcoidia bacterium]|nr:hypothetical protein [Dehalococcoidia bacterium]
MSGRRGGDATVSRRWATVPRRAAAVPAADGRHTPRDGPRGLIALSDASIAVVVFLITYAAIISERVHKTTAALAGGMALILLRVLDTEQAFEAVDLHVIFLLAGMMIIANTMASTGVFQWIAVRAAKVARGSPPGVLVILCAVTAVLSAFLDNVTTVVLIAPVALVVSSTLNVRPVPGLIAIALASNIGGTATLIGDPPNILIAAHADIGFVEFMLNIAPVPIITIAGFLGVAWMIAGRSTAITDEARQRVMDLDDTELIKDYRLLWVSLGVLALTLAGFLLQGPLGYDPAAVALMGGSLLLLLTRADPHHALREIEWTTLFFFIGLFIVVAGLEETGVLASVGERAADLAGGSEVASALILLWMSGLLSGIIDNIPYTVTMLPIVDELNAGIGLTEDDGTSVLWWALAMGADLGGNLTVIGASANVLVASLAERGGHPIRFVEFLLWGIPTVLASMLIATAYLWLRYLAF